MRRKVDFLIIGSGIAGLSYALKVAAFGKVCLVTKGSAKDSNTIYAQGGIAAVMYTPDTYNKHINDTLICGHGLCDEEVVKMTIHDSTARVNELIGWGIDFDKTESGKFDLGKEGGHSESRVLHTKDNTGFEIEKTLLQKVKEHKNIEILENHFTVDIITEHHLGIEVNKKTKEITCFGAYVLDPKTNLVKVILAKTTLMATGGIGNVYNVTTNPPIATGDGIAMVYRAKGQVENMEFMQFHPTSLYNPKVKPSFLISEALRGFGAILRTLDGKDLMSKYDKRGSLAPRDIVAKAIDTEMKISGEDHVYLDSTHLDAAKLIDHFPNIYNYCLKIGIDITKEMIPVVPAAHYICGGIKVDKRGQSSIQNLYASGECASTGLHGANRLASNSLLEALVFSHNAAMDAINKIHEINYCENIPDWNAEGMVLNEEMVLITHAMKELQSMMSSYVGIVRSNLRLKGAFDRLELLYQETEEIYNRSVLTVKICELRNLINVAYIIIKLAMERKESRGLHYSLDYPESKN